MDIKNQLQQLFDNAINSKEGLIKLKSAAIANQQYELAAELRKIEKENFPEQPHETQAKEVQLLLRMVNINVEDPKQAWIVYNTITQYNANKKKFDIKCGIKIQQEAEELFKKWQYTEKGKQES